MLLRAVSVALLCATSFACRSASTSSEALSEAPAPVPTQPEQPAAPAPVEEVAQAPEAPFACIFGDDVDELETASELKRIGTTERTLSPRAASGTPGKPKVYAVSEYLHLPSGIYYKAYATFRDEDDDGSTQGWIEKAEGAELVAEIKDAKIISCRVSRSKKGGNGSSFDSCLFGTNLEELDQSSAFAATKQADQKRPSRREGDEDDLRSFQVAELRHTQKNLSFRIYRTYRDEDDGGNTIGWIESAKDGQVVAEIGDSDIYRCSLTSTGVMVRTAAASGESCRFGSDLHDLDISDEFESSAKGETSRPSRVAGDDARPKRFVERELKHRQTGQVFLVFNTFRDEDDDGKTIGWIESAKDGQVVAEIVSSGIYNCRF